MTHSRSRGLLYTTPPTEDDKPSSEDERTEPTVEQSNHGHAVADD